MWSDQYYDCCVDCVWNLIGTCKALNSDPGDSPTLEEIGGVAEKGVGI